MSNIVSGKDFIKIDNYTLPKGGFGYSQSGDKVNVYGDNIPRFSLEAGKTTADGEDLATVEEIISFLDDNSFASSTAVSMGIQSITGDLVDNTDAQNPEILLPTWTQVSEKPATFPPAAHNHTISQITDLQTELDGKQPSGFYVTDEDLTLGLAGKADVGDLPSSSQLVPTPPSEGTFVLTSVDGVISWVEQV